MARDPTASKPPPEPEAARWAGREPDREVNGFITMGVSVGVSVMYFGWAYLPETFAAVVTADAPNRYWAIAVPMHLCVTTAVIFLCFLGHSLWINPGSGDFRAISEDPETLRNRADPWVLPTMPDQAATATQQDRPSRATAAHILRVVPVLADIPLQRVNVKLYGS